MGTAAVSPDPREDDPVVLVGETSVASREALVLGDLLLRLRPLLLVILFLILVIPFFLIPFLLLDLFIQDIGQEISYELKTGM